MPNQCDIHEWRTSYGSIEGTGVAKRICVHCRDTRITYGRVRLHPIVRHKLRKDGMSVDDAEALMLTVEP